MRREGVKAEFPNGTETLRGGLRENCLARLSWPGNPPTKKTSPQIIQLAKDSEGKYRKLAAFVETLREQAELEISHWRTFLENRLGELEEPNTAMGASVAAHEIGLRLAAMDARDETAAAGGILRARRSELLANLDSALGHEGLKTLVIPSPDYKKAVAEVVPPLREAWEAAGGRPLGGEDEPLRIEAHPYLGPRQRPDVSGLFEAVADLLQEAGVVANDSWIESWDGSRRHKDDRAHPRTEITIWRWEDERCPALF